MDRTREMNDRDNEKVNEAYAREEMGDLMALETQERKAKEREIKSLTTKLGTAKKQNARLSKRIEELEALNKSYMNENERVKNLRAKEHKRRMELEERVRALEGRIADKVGPAIGIYSQRLCYMIDTYADGILADADVEAWSKGKEFNIILKEDDEGNKTWHSLVREEGADDVEQTDKPQDAEEQQ